MVKPIIKGNEVSKYKNLINEHFVFFPYEIKNEKSIPLKYEAIKNKYPLATEFLKKNEAKLRSREKRKFDNDNEWFLFTRKQGINDVERIKIMSQEISFGCNLTLDQTGNYYHTTTVYSFVKNENFKIDEKYYLGILNSKVMWFFLKNTGTELRGGYFRFKTNYLKPFPLPKISENAQVIINKVNNQLLTNKNLQEVCIKLQRTLQRKFEGLEKLPKKLQDWYLLGYSAFIKELAKKKIKLSLSEEAEWEGYFTTEQQKALALKTQIDQTDKEIDKMVYELYELTPEEIEIVENS